ncbi:MAG: hypothetical protein NTW76_14270, partial [Corynebacteriales bacterium]|nr:hypothetical protein [Mycobacteriales bacterium]
SSSGKAGLVDTMIALWDLLRVGGPDIDQAAMQLEMAILRHDEPRETSDFDRVYDSRSRPGLPGLE